jgi:hypothetical protein
MVEVLFVVDFIVAATAAPVSSLLGEGKKLHTRLGFQVTSIEIYSISKKELKHVKVNTS